jgi:hypothetical protein
VAEAPLFDPVEREPAYTRVSSAIEAKILSRALRDGDVLPRPRRSWRSNSACTAPPCARLCEDWRAPASWRVRRARSAWS